MTDSLKPSGDAPEVEAPAGSAAEARGETCAEPRAETRAEASGRADADPVQEARAAFRLIAGGRDAPASGDGAAAEEGAAARRRRRAARAMARSSAEPGPEEVADAALLLLTSVRGAEDAEKVAERLATEVDPGALGPALAALSDRVALLQQAARRRPLPV